jgi:hypothetical protein
MSTYFVVARKRKATAYRKSAQLENGKGSERGRGVGGHRVEKVGGAGSREPGMK